MSMSTPEDDDLNDLNTPAADAAKQNHENLTAALQGSLRLIEGGDGGRGGEAAGPGAETGFSTSDEPSPLAEVTPDSVDFLLDEINNAFREGLPQKITDEKLWEVVQIYRAQGLRFAQEEQRKAAGEKKDGTPRKKRTPSNAVDLDLDLS